MKASALFAPLLALASCAHRADFTEATRAPASSLSEQVLIVSDFDDTAKPTNVGNKCAAVVNALFGKHLFAGYSTLMRGWKPETGPRLEILSNSPTLLRGRVLKTLERNNLEDARIHLRRLPKPGEAHKTDTLLNLAYRNRADLILMGDDVEKDPQVFEAVANEVGSDRFTIYMHLVRGDRALPDGQIPYVTTFDVAYEEVLRGRYDVAHAEALGQELLASFYDPTAFKTLLPNFVFCPRRSYVDCNRSESTALNAVCQALENAVVNACLARR